MFVKRYKEGMKRKEELKGLRYVDDVNKEKMVEGWFSRHWKQILFFCLGFCLLTVMWSMWNIRGLKNAIEHQAKAIDSLAKRVIIATPDGRVAILQTVDPPISYVNLVVRNFVLNHLIFGGLEIQNVARNDINAFKNWEKVYLGVMHCETEECKRLYEGFLSAVWNSYIDGVLPEIVYVKMTQLEETFKVQDKEFVYSGRIPVKIFFVRQGAWRQAEAHVDVELAGKIDFSRATPENPWGLRFRTLKVTLPVIVKD